MAVIPWLEYGLMAPENSELVKRNPTWVTRRQDGSTLITLGANQEVRLVRLNPAHPEVRQFLTELVQEVVEKYDVDGVQFDDHFGWPVDMGYDDFTAALYRQDHNGSDPPTNVRDPEWMRWRARFLTDLWVSLFAKVRFHRPQAVVSLAPNPRVFSYNFFLQDWYRWARLGLIDELIVQVYRDNLGTYATELTASELHDLQAKFPVAVGVLTGLRIRAVDMGLISDQVNLARLFGLDGFSYFFYETLGARDGAFQTLHGEVRPRPRKR
ncbi:MAG: family 10 glycosylhydrolase [Oscillatoriales cyanobacterium SM2_1_8]|nr:family 10 glycosylhydrolase [Oscillatoriales cyanobacterium SM2_1_8]